MAAEHLSPALTALADALEEALGQAAVQRNRPLARYTAFRIGGPADLLAVVESGEALRQAVILAWDRDVPCHILGGGSNVLVSDTGVRGLVVLNRGRDVRFAGASVRAASGVSFSTLARQCITQGLAGLEWAVSIPGTVGGAVVGNAGAWGSDMASTLSEALVLGTDGNVKVWPVERFEYGYRTSVLKRQGIGERGTRYPIVLGAEFALQKGDREALETKASEITARRKASQPPGATCGSVFKNPPDDYAGRLIEAAGLKGHRIGDAQISPVHANFIVNHGEAAATEVKALIDRAREDVQAQFGVALELEIELLGDW